GAKDTGNYYEFTVSDNGPGIESQFHDKIFALFQTLEARDKVESTGIGLSIIKKIIDEQRGNITSESEKGKGAKFIFTWPKESREEGAGEGGGRVRKEKKEEGQSRRMKLKQAEERK